MLIHLFRGKIQAKQDAYTFVQKEEPSKARWLDISPEERAKQSQMLKHSSRGKSQAQQDGWIFVQR
jgi:hypothetical protein